MHRLGSLVFLLLSSSSSFATFLPDNDLWKQDRLVGYDQTTMTEVEFNKVIDRVYDVFESSVKLHGGTLVVSRDWKNSTVNAYSNQSEKTWKVAMFGGLARRPEINADGFTIVMCHEMGHHLGGYPYATLIGSWAASEGQADYFATDVCARRVWVGDQVENSKFRYDVELEVKNKCDAVWKGADDQNLCYRINAASKNLGRLLAYLGKKTAPQFSTPDKSIVHSTLHRYPSAQCRLDTYLRGSLCAMTADLNEVPGRKYFYQNGPRAEMESLRSYCSKGNQPEGARPECWFRSKL